MIEAVFDMSKDKDKKRLYSILKALKPIKYAFKIKQVRKKRSLNQNNYYFGVIVKTLASELGYFPDEMHEILKQKFRPKEVIIKATGEVFTVGASTTEDKTYDAEEYYYKIRTWALSELDILIPLPNEDLN